MNDPCKLAYIKGQTDLIDHIKRECLKIAETEGADTWLDIYLLLKNLKPIPKSNLR